MEYILTDIGLVPKIGLGTFSIPKDKLYEIIPAALQLGCTLFDTANKYQNESIIGNILLNADGKRDDYYLQTKVNAALLLGNIRYLRINKKSIKRTFIDACEKLRTHYIDVFMIHHPFEGYEKFLKDLFLLKYNKVIGLVGVCNPTLDQLIQLKLKNLLPDIVQLEIHPYNSNKALLSFCNSNNVLVEARSPFAHGDAMADWLNEPILVDIAERHKAKIPQVILRWLTLQNIIALPRTTNIQHLKENVSSFQVELSKEDILAIDSLNINKSFGFITNQSQRSIN